MNTKSVPPAQAQAQYVAAKCQNSHKSEADIERAVTEAFSVVFRRESVRRRQEANRMDRPKREGV